MGIFFSVYTIQALSFQAVPLTYSMTSDAATLNLFNLNGNTGAITLMSPLVYLRDAHQYYLNVTVNEQYTNFVTTTSVWLYY